MLHFIIVGWLFATPALGERMAIESRIPEDAFEPKRICRCLQRGPRGGCLRWTCRQFHPGPARHRKNGGDDVDELLYDSLSH